MHIDLQASIESTLTGHETLMKVEFKKNSNDLSPCLISLYAGLSLKEIASSHLLNFCHKTKQVKFEGNLDVQIAFVPVQ